MRRVLTCESRDLYLWSHGVVWHTKEPDSCWSPQADSIAIVRDCLVVKIVIMWLLTFTYRGLITSVCASIKDVARHGSKSRFVSITFANSEADILSSYLEIGTEPFETLPTGRWCNPSYFRLGLTGYYIGDAFPKHPFVTHPRRPLC